MERELKETEEKHLGPRLRGYVHIIMRPLNPKLGKRGETCRDPGGNWEGNLFLSCEDDGIYLLMDRAILV
jgi:hypothetical protein